MSEHWGTFSTRHKLDIGDYYCPYVIGKGPMTMIRTNKPKLFPVFSTLEAFEYTNPKSVRAVKVRQLTRAELLDLRKDCQGIAINHDGEVFAIRSWQEVAT